MDCPDLKAAAEDFFQLHFTEVYKLDEFLHLDVTQLTHLLHQDKLTVRAEAQVHQQLPSHPTCNLTSSISGRWQKAIHDMLRLSLLCSDLRRSGALAEV